MQPNPSSTLVYLNGLDQLGGLFQNKWCHDLLPQVCTFPAGNGFPTIPTVLPGTAKFMSQQQKPTLNWGLRNQEIRPGQRGDALNLSDSKKPKTQRSRPEFLPQPQINLTYLKSNLDFCVLHLLFPCFAIKSRALKYSQNTCTDQGREKLGSRRTIPEPAQPLTQPRPSPSSPELAELAEFPALCWVIYNQTAITLLSINIFFCAFQWLHVQTAQEMWEEHPVLWCVQSFVSTVCACANASPWDRCWINNPNPPEIHRKTPPCSAWATILHLNFWIQVQQLLYLHVPNSGAATRLGGYLKLNCSCF